MLDTGSLATVSRGEAGTMYVLVVLAKRGSCDACDKTLKRGARVRMVVHDPGEVTKRFRCIECYECGREPEYERVSVPREAKAPLARVPAGLSPALPVLVTAAITTALAGVRTVKRGLLTAWVGFKSTLSILSAKLRGDREAGPRVLRHAFEDLGPTYVKLGQLVASSQGLFPEAYCREFQHCLDRVRPFPFEDVMRTLREDLGRDPAEVFASIDEKPLASASIAQVHAARLLDGSEVVIKVQRPGIGETVTADMRVLDVLARLMTLVPLGDLANPVAIVEDFEATLREELDFRREAANMDEFNRIMAEHGHAEVAAPAVRHELTSARVLVMERFFGHRVDDVEQLRAREVDGEAKLLLGLRAWFQCMIFHGFFHGDVHAGNLMALLDGRIGFLDFGIVGRFLPERRAQVTDYLMAFASGDFRKLGEVMVAMGSVEATVDLDALAKDLQAAYEPVLGDPEGAKYADLIPVVLRTSVKHRMRMPRDFVLITKQMLYFDRYAKILAPKLNLFRDPRVVGALAEDVAMAQLAALASALRERSARGT